MGWTTLPVEFSGRDAKKVKEFFEKEFTSTTVGGHNITVLYQHIRGRVLYQALEYKKDDDVYVMANIVLFSITKGELSFKDMLESAGPNKSQANRTLLNLLTPTDSKYAIDWRKRCEDNLATKPRKYEDGDIIEFAKDIYFNGGLTLRRFILRKKPTAKGGFVIRFEHPEYDYEFNIRGWKNIHHTTSKGAF